MNFWYYFAAHMRPVTIIVGLLAAILCVICVVADSECVFSSKIRFKLAAIALAVLALGCAIGAAVLFAYVDAHEPQPPSFFALPMLPECPHP